MTIRRGRESVSLVPTFAYGGNSPANGKSTPCSQDQIAMARDGGMCRHTAAALRSPVLIKQFDKGETTMNRKRLITLFLLMGLILTAGIQAQQPASHKNRQAAAANPVTGSGTVGRLVKWAGIFGDQTYAIGDSSITEDKFGNVRIGNAFSGVRFSVSKAMPGDDGIFAEGGDARCQTCTGGLGVLGRGGNGLLFG